MTIKFSDVQTFLTTALTALGTYATIPPIQPGPVTDVALQKRSPNAEIFVQVGSGAGLDVEQLFDRPFIIVRAVGNQRDYNFAETLALDIDKIMCSVTGNAVIGTAPVLYIVRTGARPELVERDSGDRWHFQCTYITEAQTGF